MPVSRQQLGLLFLGLLTVTAGCSSGLISGDGPIEFTSSPVSIADSAVQEAGFEEVDTRQVTINRTVEVQDEERELVITNYAAAYQKSSEQGDSPVAVATVSTPKAQAFGFALNPVGNMPMKEAVTFATQAGAQFGGDVEDVEQVSTWETTVLGEETTVHKFSATVTRDGETVDVYVHLTRVPDGDDFVLVAAAYPQALEEEGLVSQADLAPMFEGVEHETDDS